MKTSPGLNMRFEASVNVFLAVGLCFQTPLPPLCYNKNAFAIYATTFSSFKLYYEHTLNCVFKDRISSANQ